MDRYKEIEAFVQVMEHGSLAAAAGDRDQPGFERTQKARDVIETLRRENCDPVSHGSVLAQLRGDVERPLMDL